MDKKIQKWQSEYLNKEMEIRSFGHYRLTLLLIRNSGTNFDDCINLVDSLEHIIKIGKCKIFLIDNVDEESWGNKDIDPKQRSRRQFEYNNYIEEEVVNYIYSECGGPVPLMTCGADNGAYHAANLFFRRPDIFLGTIAVSGFYDIKMLTDGFFDDNCYYNSPVHYLPNLNDNYWLSYLLSRKHIYLASGSGSGENPEKTQELTRILFDKGIHHHTEIWGTEWDKSPRTWIAMLKYFLENKL